MDREPNPYEAPQRGTADEVRSSSLAVCLLAYLAFGFAGLVVGSYISVHVGKAWYPADADGDVANETIAAVVSSPIAMTFGVFPSLGFYGPLHGVLMLLGMAVTGCGTWLQFRSRRLIFAWVVLVGMILWSHNNHLAFAAIMSV